MADSRGGRLRTIFNLHPVAELRHEVTERLSGGLMVVILSKATPNSVILSKATRREGFRVTQARGRISSLIAQNDKLIRSKGQTNALKFGS